jgi:hypothetical protein
MMQWKTNNQLRTRHHHQYALLSRIGGIQLHFADSFHSQEMNTLSKHTTENVSSRLQGSNPIALVEL